MRSLQFLARHLLSPLALACAVTLPLACNEPEASAPPVSAKPEPSVFSAEATTDEQLENFHVTFQVTIDGQDAGKLTCRLWPNIAPKTVRNFLEITSSGFYNGLSFHRILGNFMVQAGCENGVGNGTGPFAPIPGEFSDAEQAKHVYGTLSMARGRNPDSAGAQFFIICDDGPSAWGLDGSYASFGQVVEGVATLEAIAAVPVDTDARGETSLPLKRVEIVKAMVVEGSLAKANPVLAPARERDTVGWPNTVEVQTLLIAVQGGVLPVDRTLAQAEERAKELLKLASVPEADFTALVRENSDDPAQMGQALPVGFRFANDGSHPKVGQREVYELSADFQERFNQLKLPKRGQSLTSQQLAAKVRELQIEMGRLIREKTYIPRSKQRALADRAFELKVGETKLIPRDPARTLDGFYLIKRIR